MPQREREGSEGDLRRRVAGALRKEVKSLERKLEKVARELASAEAAAALERTGELLKSAQGEGEARRPRGGGARLGQRQPTCASSSTRRSRPARTSSGSSRAIARACAR